MYRAFVYLVCLLALSIPAAQASDHDLQGVYTLDAAASDSIEAAIESGTTDMNFAIRGIARKRIAQTNPRYDRVRLAHSDSAITVQYDARDALEIPADGRSIPWTREDGGKYDVSAQWSPSQLVMHFNADDGQRTNTIVLSPDGLSIKLMVKLTSSHLPKPIEYTLVYRRQ
jgi:hypothetical protein